MNPVINWGLIVAGAILIMVEVLLGAISGFDFLLIGSAILLGGVLGLLTHSSAIGLAAGGILSILYLLVGRRRVRNRLRRPGIPSNTDAVLGRTALVVTEITARQAGQIQLEGEEWRALPDLGSIEDPPGGEIRFPAGASVRVSRIDGVTAYVVAAGTPSPAGGNRP